MQASINGDANGAGTKAVDPAALQNLLPASMSGWNRTSIESTGGGAAGHQRQQRDARNSPRATRAFSLKITDTGALGTALAGAGERDVQQPDRDRL